MNTPFTSSDFEFDARHIWHPYSTTNSNVELFAVESAEGVRLKLSDGREVIDGMSSWWSMVHGYNHPEMNKALKDQIDRMSHVMFGGLTHKPAVELARRLIDLTPDSMQTVFFSDSGSVAVEVAIKMAMQYWQCRGETGKTKMLTFKGGYYGDTTGGMSICDPENGMHHHFTGILPEHYFVERPACKWGDEFEEAYIEPFKQQLEALSGQVAAVIVEPIVQGAGGMYFFSPEFLKRVKELCDEHGVLLIHDEIATGFGRTGKMFACEHAGIEPDIMCVGKALTGGYMSMAATLCTAHVSDTISAKEPMMHGPTFMANPLTCAAGVASLEILGRGDWQHQVANIEEILQDQLSTCLELDIVQEVRVLGGIGVVELKEPVVMSEIQSEFPKEGVWVRPFGKLVYVMPPYVISDEDLKFLCQGIYKVLDRMYGNN
ncbi:adenosylmethionine--8-amino-7-oxononanoate transaminase [Endozoicomonas sp. OPT23]|uniref:adenosylmethionine--8-amino-7-oxononanoate transaminase n=1 Tax=Endozoicomonas sp. OPT23 TaxID=2072845 RepID=UPI00129A35A5|nr:adenosylmethionine--8-amino-7-oxononanoate transaminase [Endozoicomonas sp. OPT23]MRI33471.1 adenosylmethionine--8-amino-7-oxononanoate transaminase [Endozoicomonas sp. OPT23]